MSLGLFERVYPRWALIGEVCSWQQQSEEVAMIESKMTGKTTWSAFAAFLVLAGCHTVQGSGHVVTEERNVEDFDRVSLTGRGTIHYTQAADQELLIEAEDNIIGKLVSRVEDHKLILRERENVILDPSRPIRYHLRAPSLSRVALGGSGRFKTGALEVSFLSLELDGSSRGEISGLAADEINVEVDGSSKLTVAGVVGSQMVEVDGAARYRALDLESTRADVKVDGSGVAKVNATDELIVDIDGSGHVDYRGNPAVSKDVDGSGKLHAAD